MKKKVLAIIPAFNEKGKIGKVVKKIKAQKAWVRKVLVVDDCSSDETLQEARSAGALVLRHARNLGVGAAIRTGMEYGMKYGYDIGVILSGDDQHEPKELALVLKPILDGEVDFIQGSRYVQGGHTINQNLFRRITTRLYTLIFFLATGLYCSDVTNGFRAFDLKMLWLDKGINLRQSWLNRYELEVYLLYKVYTSGRYRKKEVPITIRYHSRKKGSTKMLLFVDWWRILRPILFLKLGVKK